VEAYDFNQLKWITNYDTHEGCQVQVKNFDICKLKYVCRFIELKECLKMFISYSVVDVLLGCDGLRHRPGDRHRQTRRQMKPTQILIQDIIFEE
jgi:hypothetical protein